ncbi:MAG: HAD family phosphatase [Phycisphaerae bacterium]|nr:HAD family phosphatase [Phycisphaerae bacterium]
MIKAVIFDFDGVITDSEIIHFRTFNMVLKPFGAVLSRKEYYANYLGLSDADLIKQLIAEGRLDIDNAKIEELCQKKNKAFEKLLKEDGNLIDGVRDFLARLKENNILMAICSGALLSEIMLVLEDSRIEGFFESVVSADQVKKGKPHPEGFLLALKRVNKKHNLNIQPKDCVVVEDSRWGLQAANTAGMHSLAITNSYEAKELKIADKIVDHLDEVSIDMLHKLCN